MSSYLLVAVLPLAGLAAFYLASFEASLRETVLANMTTIADKKAEQIDSYMAERLADAKQLSQRQVIRNGLAALERAFHADGLNSPAYRAADQRLRDTLGTSYGAEGFYDLLLLDKAGNVVFSIAQEPDTGASMRHSAYRDTQLAKGFDQAMQTLQAHLSPFALYPPSGNQPAAFLVVPILENGMVAGTLALQLDVSRLESVTADRTGLGRTGETVLVQKDGDDAVYTAPLRHVREAAYRYRKPLRETPLPMQKALSGDRGRDIIRDYAGIEGVAAWRYLPALGWGMVVKIDTAEALAPALQLRRITYLALGFFLMLSGIAAYFLGRGLSRPIRSLTRVVDRIAAGDLSQRAPQEKIDELNRLARAFNHMTDALADARYNLEAQVEARSQELREISSLQSAILDQAGALVLVLDREGRIRRFNRACEELTHYSFAEAEGRFVWDFLLTPEERDSVHEEAFDALVSNPHVLRASHTNYWVARDGTRRLIEWSNTLLLDERGETAFMVGIGIDVTEKRMAEAALQESEQRLSAAQRIAQVGSWELDLASGKLTWSDEIFRLFEVDKAAFDVSYEAFLGAIHPEDRDRVNRAYTDSLTTRTPYEIVHRLRMPDGRVKWVNERCETFFDAQGTALRSRGTVQDITERKQVEEALRLYANVFEHSGEAILITDSGNRILAVNPAFTRLTGYAIDEIRGDNPRILASGQTPAETYQAMWTALNETGYWQGEIIDRRKDATLYPKWMSISAVRDADGQIAHYVASFTDISERKAAEAQIRHLAYHDALTGLLNRFSLQSQLEQALAMTRREQRALAVIFLDLDRFKTINDTLGHAVGDALLKEAARRLRDNTRESDIVARLGGDEFVVVLTEVDDVAAAARVAQKILQVLAQRYRIGEKELHSTASIGLAFYPGDGEDGDTLMKNADAAMYHAKSLGRNNVQFFTAEMNLTAVKRLMLEHDLRMAIETNQFELHYQPQLDSWNGRVVGVEALVRWRHPRNGLVSPALFIPVAEETGMILPLGGWVLDEACRQLRAWRDAGVAEVTMAVNLSAHQLHSPVLLAQVAQALEKHGLTGTDLELEITESAAMHDPDASIRQLKALRDLGVRLSIDDFGTGYSSLSYLKLLPIHTLKLDQSFVRDIESDANDVAICTATIALAHNLGLAVTAEGVETEAQRLLLTSHHCDFMQGYLFSKPLPADAALAFIQARAPAACANPG
ncbi:EAL domain-containing protein [uncultured Thiobacillus sp.]|uniref:EAL domain-containing protein n=3 Tax=Thiobacillus TaxID=919 RepID=UPI002609159F|nr:EAL domain-containing protein [uncultured Thiobacillus sp.]